MIAALVAGAALVAAWAGDDALAAAIAGLPALLSAAPAPPPRALVDLIAGAKSAFVLGRGATFAIAAEAALKLKETCAIHAEAFSSAEVLHGPAGVIAPGFLVIAFVPQDAAREGMLRRCGGSPRWARAARRGRRGAAAERGARRARAPPIPLLTPIVMIHRFYGLVEACARALGRDPDQPPHLNKVTETI